MLRWRLRQEGIMLAPALARHRPFCDIAGTSGLLEGRAGCVDCAGRAGRAGCAGPPGHQAMLACWSAMLGTGQLLGHCPQDTGASLRPLSVISCFPPVPRTFLPQKVSVSTSSPSSPRLLSSVFLFVIRNLPVTGRALYTHPYRYSYTQEIRPRPRLSTR